MKHKPAPYNKSNLIDFSRPNMWMNTVKGSKTTNGDIPAVQVVVIMAIILMALIGLDMLGVIEVVKS